MPPTTTTLLICYDGSREASNAMEQAAECFPNAQAVVVNVWQPIEEMSHSEWMLSWNITAFDDSLEKESKHLAQFGSTLANSLGLNARAETLKAGRKIGETIVRRSKDAAIDVIVVGSAGHSTIGGALVGSVTQYIMHHAGKPVFFVRPPKLSRASEISARAHQAERV